jgi:hypothetical protein
MVYSKELGWGSNEWEGVILGEGVAMTLYQKKKKKNKQFYAKYIYIYCKSIFTPNLKLCKMNPFHTSFI